MPHIEPQTAPLLSPAKMGGAGLRTFLNIAKEWELTVADQMRLLGVAPRTFHRWKKAAQAGADVEVSSAVLERLSYILGIYKGLRIVLPESYAGWVKRPNSAPLFGGGSALDRMLGGQVADLFQVRQYVDSWRGGWA